MAHMGGLKILILIGRQILQIQVEKDINLVIKLKSVDGIMHVYWSQWLLC